MCTNGVKNASVNWWAANLRSLFSYAETSYALTRPLKFYSPLISIIDKITKRRVISPVLLKINKYTCVRWGRRRKTVAWLYNLLRFLAPRRCLRIDSYIMYRICRFVWPNFFFHMASIVDLSPARLFPGFLTFRTFFSARSLICKPPFSTFWWHDA